MAAQKPYAASSPKITSTISPGCPCHVAHDVVAEEAAPEAPAEEPVAADAEEKSE